MKLKGKAKESNIWGRNLDGRLEFFMGTAAEHGYSPEEFATFSHIASAISSRWLEDEKGRKQGIEQVFDLSKNAKSGTMVGRVGGVPIYRYLCAERFNVDDEQNGPEICYDEQGRVRRISPYVAGHQNGITTEYTYGPNNERTAKYTFYKDGDVVKSDTQLRKEWADVVEGLKFEKEMDEAGRSATLEKVLQAGTKEGKKEALREFHSKTGSMGVKRRTGLKFDR